MFIGREDQKIIFSHADFTRLCNVTSRFHGFNLDILKGGITFTLSYSSRTCKRRKNVITNLQKHKNKFFTRTYGDYTMTEHYFSQDCPFKISIEMRATSTILI